LMIKSFKTFFEQRKEKYIDTALDDRCNKIANLLLYSRSLPSDPIILKHLIIKFDIDTKNIAKIMTSKSKHWYEIVETKLIQEIENFMKAIRLYDPKMEPKFSRMGGWLRLSQDTNNIPIHFAVIHALSMKQQEIKVIETIHKKYTDHRKLVLLNNVKAHLQIPHIPDIIVSYGYDDLKNYFRYLNKIIILHNQLITFYTPLIYYDATDSESEDEPEFDTESESDSD